MCSFSYDPSKAPPSRRPIPASELDAVRLQYQLQKAADRARKESLSSSSYTQSKSHYTSSPSSSTPRSIIYADNERSSFKTSAMGGSTWMATRVEL